MNSLGIAPLRCAIQLRASPGRTSLCARSALRASPLCLGQQAQRSGIATEKLPPAVVAPPVPDPKSGFPPIATELLPVDVALAPTAVANVPGGVTPPFAEPPTETTPVPFALAAGPTATPALLLESTGLEAEAANPSATDGPVLVTSD